MKHVITGKKILAHRFFRDFTPITPYMAVYFARNGMSVAQISLLFLVWSVTSILLEIPTGVIGDRYDRKKVLVIAQATKLLAFCAWLISPTFIGFMAGLILWGIAASLDSGTFQAFLFDMTKANTRTQTFKDLYSKSHAAAFAGLFTATVVASVIVGFGFRYLLMSSIAGLAMSTILIFFVSHRENEQVTIKKEHTPALKSITNSFAYIKKQKMLAMLFIVGVAAAGMKAPLDDYHSLFFEHQEVPLFAIGIIIASFELVKSAGAFVSAKINLQEKQQSYALIAVGILLVGATQVSSYLAAAMLLTMIIVDMTLWMANDASIQEHAADDNRATLMSVKMFSGELVAAIMLGIFAILSQFYPVPALYIASGAMIIIIGTFTTSILGRQAQT